MLNNNEAIRLTIDYCQNLLKMNSKSINIEIVDNLKKSSQLQLMAYNAKRDVVEIRQSFFNKTSAFGLFIGLSHELAHRWQALQANGGNEKYLTAFKEYRPSIEFDNVDDYNLQTLEFEANIYATIVALDNGIIPTFDALSDKLRNEIHDKAKSLIEKFNNQKSNCAILELL